MCDKIMTALKQAEKIGIFTHVSPDGDAMGSSYSLKLALQGMGKIAEVFLLPNADGKARAVLAGTEKVGIDKSDCDMLVALDCADAERLGEYKDFFVSHPNTAAIDHHVTHKPYAVHSIVHEASSTCEIMAELYNSFNIPITADMAQDLYIGIATDTGCFKFSCTTPQTMRTAACLMETGIDTAELSRRLFTVKSSEYYSLLRSALDKLTCYEDGKICVLHLSCEDFEKAGISESQSSEIVSLPLTTEGSLVGVYIRDRGNGEYKVSLRSNHTVDVAKTALTFGGGGHVRAAGYSVYNSSPDAILVKLLTELKKQM